MSLVEKCQVILSIHQKILENGGTPYILVNVNDVNRVRVPIQHVKDGKIVLNISMVSANNLFITENGIQFGARFSGKHFSIDVPLENVMAIYARESGEGVFFDEPLLEYHRSQSSKEPVAKEEPAAKPNKSFLRVVK